MSLYRDEGVVLRAQKLGEADRIVTLLTREHGRVRVRRVMVHERRTRVGHNPDLGLHKPSSRQVRQRHDQSAKESQRERGASEGRAEEIAAMVRFLVGPEGRYVTGQTIHVNGGLFLGK